MSNMESNIKIINTLRHVIGMLSETNEMLECLCIQVLGEDWKARKGEFSTGPTTTRVDSKCSRPSESFPHTDQKNLAFP